MTSLKKFRNYLKSLWKRSTCTKDLKVYRIIALLCLNCWVNSLKNSAVQYSNILSCFPNNVHKKSYLNPWGRLTFYRDLDLSPVDAESLVTVNWLVCFPHTYYYTIRNYLIMHFYGNLSQDKHGCHLSKC